MGVKFGYALALVLTVGVLAIGCGDEPANGDDGDGANAGQAAPATAAGAPNAGAAPWQQTLAFVTHLEELMQGYRPSPTALPGGPSLACVPQAVLRANRSLSSEAAQLERMRAQAAREQAEAREATMRAAGVYDPLWQRRTRAQAAGGHCEWARNFSSNYMRDTIARTRGQCRTRVVQGVNRNRRWVPGPARTVYVHSGGTAPPAAAPALMSLAEGASVVAPEALVCRVRDVEGRRRGGGATIVCEVQEPGSVTALRVHVSAGDIGWWTEGASLSMPLGGPNSVYVQRDPSAEGTWTIHAEADQVSIVDPGSCPSPEALLESVRAAAGEGE